MADTHDEAPSLRRVLIDCIEESAVGAAEPTDRGKVTFHRLGDDDLPTMHRWLNEPGVVRWWEGDDVSWDGIVRDYGSANTDPGEHWIASLDGRDIGWIQCYAAAEYEEESHAWFSLGVDRTAAGIDYLIADPASRGAGLGSRMIRAFVRDVVFGMHPTWTQACASPHVDNVPSWRALARAGFREVADIEARDGTWKLMVIDRSAA